MKKHRILVIDDDPINLSIITELLDDQYELQTLDRGDGAITVAREFYPDLILLDIMMPGIDGYEVCRQLRDAHDLRHLKIILVSARARVEERLKGYEVGADDYIVKPFDLLEFKAKVSVFLRLKSVEEVNDLKTSLLQLFNHDTRTPLTGIIAPAEMLLKQDPVDDNTVKNLAEIILQSGRRLHSMFERVGLLTKLRVEGVEVPTFPTDLSAVVNRQIHRASQRHPGKPVDILGTDPVKATVSADEAYLETILESLLDNAVEHSPEGGKIEVSVQVGDGMARIAVRDQGPGIRKEFLPHIFEGLHVQDLDNQGQGQGLSLALSKAMAEAMGGDIRVESQPNRSTTFEVALPLAA